MKLLRKHITTLVAIAATAVSGCVYPYDSPVPGSQYSGIVVEGDLLVGGVSEISLSRMLPLTGEAPDSLTAPVSATVRAENDRGDTFAATGGASGQYRIDLSAAPLNAAYRLKVTTADGAVFSTPFTAPSGTCTLDDLKYTINGQDVDILLDMHSDGASRHFRYSYHETWEYHSDVMATVWYDPTSTPANLYGSIIDYKNGENSYYCWKTVYSRGINLFTTETMDVDALKDYPILSRSMFDQKFSILYRLDMDVYPVDSNSYRYYEHLKEVSTFNGSLFSPIPSELAGNVRCESDPDRVAYGYVAVVRPSSRRLEIKSTDVGYYNKTPVQVSYYISDNYVWMYNAGYLPVEKDPMLGTIWTEARCVDCRKSGGTKNKPADWPNTHK